MLKSSFVLAAVALAAAVPASAVVVTPVSVTASSTQTHGGFYKAENLINGSGLSGDLHDSNFANMWMTNQGVGAAQALLTFDLGAVYTLTSADIWQYNFGTNTPVISTLDRGVKDFRILTSLDGASFAEVFSGRMERAPDGSPIGAQRFAIGGDARYVQIDILSNYAEGTIYTTYSAGLSEVRFNAVPEPATWAMMIGGFALVGGAVRRTRRAAPLAA
ncbi:PEPxxWA-CTERM sorting domain-containing protein [Sphingomonas flavalba]|uniref:PEPxxWA-CTERM sorting domain-containing protein n=1 Tax=Sphingomonas flavalba TaxID=2559804 RepID=UPI001446AC9C|nr:PEPxxWA-CTERM sorting domain-containing protein [Sphingomonas flavalba]